MPGYRSGAVAPAPRRHPSALMLGAPLRPGGRNADRFALGAKASYFLRRRQDRYLDRGQPDGRAYVTWST